jgi:transcriptional regulator
VYIPPNFQIKDKKAQFDFIHHYGFGDLITTLDNKLEINHAPFLLDESNEMLLCHLARANNHWQLVEKADDLRVCFKGPDAYISPNWYADNKNVPTWNFLSVQVTGKAQLMTESELVDLLIRLSQKHEAKFARPWTIDKMPEGRFNAMLKAIVGIKISIDHIEGKAKLSQNKSAQEQQDLIAGLSGESDAGSKAVLDWMAKNQ